jgi:rod shape-determining protein MreC
MLSSFSITDTNFYFEDTVYRYTNASIIENSVNRYKNYMVLNKGRKHGIKRDMGVISPHGIAGIIIGVSENFSIAMSLLHNSCQISALISKNNQIVNVSWDGQSSEFGILKDIPTHINLVKGDTVISSGYSHIFPKGLNIGIVEEYYNDKNNNLNTAKISFSTDFDQLTNVYIIEYVLRDELNSLMESVSDE